jgi:energy-converting hydrogenase B subunit D
MTPLIGLLLLLEAAAGAAVALTRRPRRQVLTMSVNGQVLALLFMVLQAPDVAFSEITVGAAVLPLMFLVMLASCRMDRSGSGQDET